MNYKRYWNEHCTTIEKAYFVRVADLLGVVTVFTDTDVSPKWQDIESNHQQKLREAIVTTLGGSPNEL